MRALLKLILPILPLLLLNGMSWADVSPDVEVRLVSPFTAVKAGEVYQGRLEIVCNQDGQLDGFRIAGSGWDALIESASRTGAVSAGETVTVEFTATSSQPDRTLEFSCEFSGYTVRHLIDLSEANVDRMTSGGAVQELPAFLDIPGDRSRSELDDLLGPASSEVTGEGRRQITVTGRFGATLPSGGFFPAHSILVEVWDEDVIGEDLLGYGYTNYDGYYTLTVESTDGDIIGDPDIFVRFTLSNSRIRVYEPTSEDTYFYGTGVYDNYSGTELDLGTLIPADGNQHPAVFLHTQGSRAWVHDYLLGYDVSACRVEWPSAAWPNCSPGGRIQMRNDFSWNDGTLWHEYGHWFDHEIASWEPWDYCNGVCDFDGCGHCFWCEESEVIAWLEGWAQFHSYGVSAWSDGYYGFAPLDPVDAENINTCGGSYDESLITEGFIAALTQDMSDSQQDAHGAFGDYEDRMSGGLARIFQVNALDNPTGSQDFADKYVARFPADREVFWETAANCGFWFDTQAPGAVTGLNSTSHTAGVSSPDPTVTFAWTAASDNYSGIAGYGLAISAGGVVMPSQVMDIGDLTTYTTDPLSPGTYYFSIRAVDNAGYWSANYAWWGPIVVRDPDPADLTSYQATGWDFPLVPRMDNDSGTGYAPLPATLIGDAAVTYWNVFGQNQGEASTGESFWGWLNVDGVANVGNAYWPTINPGGLYYGPNRGPIAVQAGRHSLTFRHDATDLIAEVDENNNVFGRQFIWAAPEVGPGEMVTRQAPPEVMGGWDQVTSGPTYLNCDGLTMSTGTGWWHAMAIWADSDEDDFDCRLHELSAGSQDGFDSSLTNSPAWAGHLDAVIVNRNQDATAAWNVGVTRWAGGGNYKAYHATSTIMVFGDSLTVALDEDQPIMLREFYLPADEAGPVSVTAQTDAAGGAINLLLLDRGFTYGTLFSGEILGSYATDESGFARISVDLDVGGWYGIVVYRDQGLGLPAREVTLEVSPTPPDLAPWRPADWHSALTPRPVDDGTSTWCPQPDTLLSSPEATYLNVAATNTGPVPAPLPTSVFRDGLYMGYVNWPTLVPGAQVSYNWSSPFIWSPGRHTLALRVDPAQVVEETNEGNNVHGEQWVWSPLELEPPAAVIRSAPPSPLGGWEDLTDGSVAFYNCDGLRLRGEGDGWWKAVAIRPEGLSDFDLRLHQPGWGAKFGFQGNLVGSYMAGWEVDYVLVDFNSAAFGDFDVGVIRYSGEGWYRAQAVSAPFLGSDPLGTWAPLGISAGGIMSMVEFHFPAGTYHLTVENQSEADLKLAVHREGVAYQNHYNHAIGVADSGPIGADETLDLTIAEEDEGYHCIVVYRQGWETDEAPFVLHISDTVVPVGQDDLPAATRLVGAWPNPFNPQTTVSFELARAGHARLAVYDVQGRLVQLLVDEEMSAGRHEWVWQGRDQAGRSVASGVYFARFEGPGGQGMAKVVLVK
jgi:hypothetical protein